METNTWDAGLRDMWRLANYFQGIMSEGINKTYAYFEENLEDEDNK